MPTHNRYIFDTSVLIAFSNLRKLDLLCNLYEEIIIPASVQDEFDEELPHCSREIGIDSSLVQFFQDQMNIGKGEAAVISHALHSNEEITCFIDDQKARKVALSLRLKLSGTVGILMKMERKGLIASAYKELLILKEKGFHISDKIIHSL